VKSMDFTENGYDSQVLLKALAEHGEASLVSQGTLLLKNNEVGNIRTSSLNRWVDIISVSDNESVAPAYKESMFQVLPSITGEQINLHMVLSDTDNEPYLKSLKREAVFNQMNNNSNLPLYKITVETGTIKLGEQFVIPTEVENGETLLIAGLTRKIYNDTTARNQMLPIIGDSKNRQQRRRETIVVMTAYLLD
jgi:type II secretory pathway component GspD/PulD (secretin)